MSIQQPAMIRADPVADPAREPTLFERAGGLPALTRMARLFYEKLVPADPLLAPLFADMRPGHPEQVAARVGEVFGGFRSAFTSCIEWESRFAAEGPRRGAAPPGRHDRAPLERGPGRPAGHPHRDRLQNGSMPCDGAWSAEKLQVLRRWTESGMQP